MIKPYTAVGLIPTVRGIRKRTDIKINIEHLEHLVKAASWLSSLDLPVRLIAFPEGALQAFNDEVLDLDHVTFARECAIDIPGEETEALGKIAKTYNAFIMAQAKAKHPEIKDRFFNVVSTVIKLAKQTWTSAVRAALIQSDLPSVPAAFQEVIGSGHVRERMKAVE
jgi:beta-ureidopropionase